MPYKVIIDKKVTKWMRKLSNDYYTLIMRDIISLKVNPRPFGCKKLEGKKNKYRIRVGVYRVVYTINDEILNVMVVNVGHRNSVYKEK
jgi:mRNA interferase RelE/StbE